jgi:hypothetical protein
MGIVPAVDHTRKGRRHHSGSIALIAGLGVLLAVGLTVLTAHKPDTAPSALTGTPAGGPFVAQPEPLVTHTVSYQLTGDGALNITYVTANSDIAQLMLASTPWSVTLSWQTPEHGSSFYSLTAQDAGQGTLNCRIVVDGAVVSERLVSGPNAVVRCSKTLS